MDDMREDLKSWYRSLSTVSISPLEEDETAPLEELFTDTIIERQTDEKNSRNKKKEKLFSYKQIFLDKNNQRIILTGLSGSGKSTFCRKLVCAWCMEEPSKQVDTTRMGDLSNCNKQMATPEKKTDLNVPCIPGTIKDIKDVKTDSCVSESSEAVADQDILLSFTLLFYVYSPKISNEKTLTEVLYNHCLKRESDQLSTFLQEHPEKILIILDGMDEMEDSISPFLSDLLERKLHPRIIVLMAMRPWRISKLKLKPVSHYDLLLEIQGFSKDNALKYVQKVIDLNKKHMTMERLSPAPDEKEMMTYFRNVPLLLLFLAHVWCQDQCLPKRRKDLYQKILDCLIKRCLNKTGDKYIIIAVTDQDDISMKKDKFWGLYIESICKAAHQFLLQGLGGPSVIMREEALMIKLGNNAQLKLCALLDCGILSKLDAFSPLEKNVSVTFLHLSIQEYLTSIHLVYNENAFQDFLLSLKTLNDVLKYENLFIFICGLDADKGHTAFKRVCEVCDEDTNVRKYRQGRDVVQYMQMHLSIWNLNEMYKTCLNEMDSQDRVEISDVTMRDKDELFKCLISRLRSYCVKSLHLEYITLLHHHLVEMRSLTNLSSLKLSTVETSDECGRFLCSSISGCTHLEWLELNVMTLHDGILDLRSLTHLIYLSLKEVTMSEECSRFLCSSISGCTHLECLELKSMTLHDGILEVKSLTNLTVLKLLYVNLSEKCSIYLCSSINGFTHLESLVLIHIILHGGVLDLTDLTKLASLTLWYVSMSEKCSRFLCSSISGCTHLEKLELKHITLHDGVLEFRSLTNLTSLRLSGLKISEDCSRSLCGSIRGCTHLEELVMMSMNLYDGVLALSSLTDLTFLTLSKVTMSMDCSRLQFISISSCSHLKSLELRQIMLHDGVLELRSLTNLTSFTLEYVTMSDECSTSLSNSISGCTHLESLKLMKIALHDGVLDARNLNKMTSIILADVTISKECGKYLCSSISGFIYLKTLELNLITLHDGVLDLRNLTDLISLTLSGVTMSRECSRYLCSSIGGHNKLSHLELKNITLHDGVLELRTLNKLTLLTLDNVIMSKECCRSLCSSISDCHHLDSVELKNITLHDGVLELKSLTNLISLSLDGVTISKECSKSLCSSISGCICLQRLHLMNISLCDGVLDLRSLTNLTTLTLWKVTMSMECSRALCSSMSGCTVLELRELNLKTLHDDVLVLRCLPALPYHVLSGVTMSGKSSGGLCWNIIGCTLLDNLQLEIIHDGILEMRDLNNLTSLKLENVTMSEECSRSLCSRISGFTCLESLYLKDIILHDGILELKSLTHLTSLTLGHVTMSEECSRSLYSSIISCIHLELLVLWDNMMHDGVLKLWSLTNLTSLELGYVTMSDKCSRSLCSSISTCIQLTRLELTDIDLHDGILELRSLANLTFLTVGNVTISEECSRSLCSSISGYTDLKGLELQYIILHDGVLELRSLTNLTTLTLWYVIMSDKCSRSLCSSISSCIHLTHLELTDINLHDGILELRSLTDLTFLKVGNVTISEECSRSLCSSISNCIQLEMMELWDYTLGDGLLELKSLTYLTSLKLGLVSGTISEECSRSLCSSISRCTQLKSLYLKDITLHDSLLELRSLTNLTFFTLGGVTMSEECSRSLCGSINGCAHLKSLDLKDITLHDGLLELKSLTNLTTLTLENVTMSEECSRSLGGSISWHACLGRLDLKNMTLHDGILELWGLISLTYFTMCGVTMSVESSRSFCNSIGCCMHLMSLELSDIKLHDGILDLRSLTNLHFLTLGSVFMSEVCSRSLCSSISGCTHLEKLKLKEIKLHDGVLDLRCLPTLTLLKLRKVTMSEECIRTLCSSINGCAELKSLELKHITFHDGVLDLRSLPNLAYLKLWEVTMSEECIRDLCSSIGGCTYLEELELNVMMLHDGVLDLKSLTNLTSLTLWDITMSEECNRSLCSSINGCAELKSLELKHITFHDGVLDLRSLPNLAYLKLWEVTMSEECIRDLCSSIGGCTYLEELELNVMMLHDGVLDLKSLTNLTSLTLWDITMSEECNRSLCSSINGCTNLESLELKHITLHDGVLDLRNLPNLTCLKLWEVTMSVECIRDLCSSIGGCTYLEELELNVMMLHDGVLDLKSLTNLTSLTLWDITMSEECNRSLCSSINGCTYIESLELKHITFHDGVLDLRNLPNLTCLKLWEVTMSVECIRDLCSSIGGCTYLEELELNVMMLHDGVLDLKSLTNLTSLTLWDITMSEECNRSLCSSINDCTNLESLELKHITLHDGVLDLRNLPNLTCLKLWEVTMSVECIRDLCSSIGGCTYLEELELNVMMLHDGVLDLKSLTDLTYFALGGVTMSEECSLSLCRSINGCTHIESLELKQITLYGGVLDLRILTNLTILKLEEVTMSEECSISLCNSISGCTYLEELELKHVALHDGVLDLRCLSHLRRLQFLSVTMSPHCRKTLLASLKNCKRLELCEILDSDMNTI